MFGWLPDDAAMPQVLFSDALASAAEAAAAAATAATATAAITAIAPPALLKRNSHGDPATPCNTLGT